jgi:hypothetical protein
MRSISGERKGHIRERKKERERGITTGYIEIYVKVREVKLSGSICMSLNLGVKSAFCNLKKNIACKCLQMKQWHFED